MEQLTPHEREILRLWGVIERLTRDLAECYRLSGEDPDGNEDWRLARHAVQAVRELREDYDAHK